MDHFTDPELLAALIEDIQGSAVHIDVDARASTYHIEPDKNPLEIRDNPLKALLRSSSREPVRFLMCSPPWNPDVVAENVEKGRAAAQSLPPKLASPILLPTEEGRFRGMSWAMYAVKQAMSKDRWEWIWQRMSITLGLVQWLTEVTAATRRDIPEPNLVRVVVSPLERMVNDPSTDGKVRSAAERAIDRLTAGVWRPKFVLAHNDFWKGNVMAPSSDDDRAQRFFIIDWAGSTVEGLPFFDLLRLSSSFAFPRLLTRAFVYRHCDVLECEVVDAESYLVSALASLGTRLNYFPKERFLSMSAHLMRLLAPIVET